MINISVSFGMEDVTEEMVKEYFRLGKSWGFRSIGQRCVSCSIMLFDSDRVIKKVCVS